MRLRVKPSLYLMLVMALLSSSALGGFFIHSYSAGGAYLAYVPLSITNKQPNATETPFQDSFSFNPSSYTAYESGDLGNIRFYTAYSGSSFSNELYAWLETYSGSSTPNLASSATVWINLPNGIAASSSITIYLVFESTSVDFDGVYWGESPLLSPSYAAFDNGANVFTIYNNGNNTFPNSQTGAGGSGPGLTGSAPAPYSNAITGSVSGGGAAANAWTTTGEVTSSLPSSYIAQEYVYLSGSSPLTDLLTNVQSISSGPFYAFRLDARSGSYDLIGNYPNGATSTNILSQATIGSSGSTWYQLTAIDNFDRLSLYKSTSFGLASFGTLEVGPISGEGYTGGGIAVTTDGASSTEYWTMIIVRDYPPNGIMPSSTLGALSLAGPSYPYQFNYVSPSASVESLPLNFQSTSSSPFVPITLTNAEGSSTQKGLQVVLNIDFRTYESYLDSDAGNIRFFNSSSFSAATELPAWLEYYSGNSSNAENTATGSAVWLALKGTVINANSFITIYMVFENGLDYDGVYLGEAPELSSVLGEYDNGANVFTYYNVAPASITGWTVKGAAGQTSSAPTGSRFNSQDAFYANSARSDYLFTSIPGLSTNTILTFWTYTTGLGNAFFLANSAGKGQMVRLDSRGGADWSGLASTSSWTSWSAPSSGLDESSGTWYKNDIVINGTGAASYIGASSNNLATLGTKANSVTVANDGNYVGLVGDALGSSYESYWNGFILRYYPPGGVLPSVSFGTIVISGVATTISPDKNAASIGLTSGLTFFESSAASSSCSTPTADTSFNSPSSSTSSSYSIKNGTSVCVWSPQYSSATTIYSGSWTSDLWAEATGSGGSISISIYTTNSTGSVVSTIVSNSPTQSIGSTVSQEVTPLSGSAGNIFANGYLKIIMSASSSGPSSFTIYYGSKSEPTNFESPSVFTNVLGISDISGSSMLLSMSISSTTGTTRLENFTVAIGPTSEISIGSDVSSVETTGPQVTIYGNSELYISFYSTAISPGGSTVTISMKWENYAGGPYSQSTLAITID